MTNRQKRFALNEAISKLQSVQFTYQNESRVGNPHAIGFTTENNEVVRIYQTEGHSSSGLSFPDRKGVNFRLFDLSHLDKVEILTDVFKVHKAFKKDDDAIDWNKAPNKQV